MPPRLRFVVPLLLAFAAGPIGAQADSTHAWRRPVSACVAAIPDSALKPAMIYLTMSSRDLVPAGASIAIETLVQSAAERVRASLGGGPDTVKPGEPRLMWRDIDGSVRVTWRRDGSADWHVEHGASAAPGDTGTTAGMSLLLRSLDELRPGPGNYLPLPWPDSVTTDSTTFTLTFVYPVFDPDGKVAPTTMRPLIPVFTLRVPHVTTVRGRTRRAPNYPRNALGQATGYLNMEYAVDTTGRADMATVHDIWPPDKPRLTGTLGGYYDDFRSEVTRWIQGARYEPARVNGCPIRQVVQQPFNFKMAR
jgi:hypothetical protein